MAENAYQHKRKGSKVIYGKTYILPDSMETDMLLFDIFADIDY